MTYSESSGKLKKQPSSLSFSGVISVIAQMERRGPCDVTFPYAKLILFLVLLEALSAPIWRVFIP